MRVEFWEPAGTVDVPGKGEFEQVFDRHAFDGVIGQDVPFRDRPGGREIGRATVVSVTVDEDGRGATWTVDVTGDAESAFPGLPLPGSFKFWEPDPDLLPHDPLAPKQLRINWRDDPGQE